MVNVFYDAVRRAHPDWLIYGSETSSATRTRDSYYNPAQILGHDTVQIVTMNNLIMVMTVLGGEEQLLSHGLLTVIVLAMLDNLSGQEFDYIGEPTPWHNQDNTPVKSSYFGIIDTAGLPKNDFTFTVVNGIVLKKSQLSEFYRIGTGLKRLLRIARCWSMERFQFVPSQMLQVSNCS